jgi:hypothetical protein
MLQGDVVGPGGRPLSEPDASRLAPDHPRRVEILAAHDAALAHEEDGYVDPASGWWVFSAAHLLDRGHCCENGCRHCPYV